MLFRRYHATRDPRLRELLVERHLGLAAQVAGRYRRASLSYDDALQLARIGLLKAIDRFDPDHGASFSSFAVPTMVGELKRFLRDHGWAVRPPRPVQERAAQVEHAAERLGGRLGRAPTARELSAETGLTLEDVLESLAAGDCRDIPMDTPVSDGAEDTLADRLGCEDPRLSQVEDGVIADQLLGQLTARDEVVLRLRFERDLTQLEDRSRRRLLPDAGVQDHPRRSGAAREPRPPTSAPSSSRASSFRSTSADVPGRQIGGPSPGRTRACAAEHARSSCLCARSRCARSPRC